MERKQNLQVMTKLLLKFLYLCFPRTKFGPKKVLFYKQIEET